MEVLWAWLFHIILFQKISKLPLKNNGKQTVLAGGLFFVLVIKISNFFKSAVNTVVTSTLGCSENGYFTTNLLLLSLAIKKRDTLYFFCTEYLIFLKKEKKQMIYSKIPLKEIVLWNIPFGWGVEPHCNVVYCTLPITFSTNFI